MTPPRPAIRTILFGAALGGAALAAGGCTSTHPSAGWRPSYTLPTTTSGSSNALVFSPGLEGPRRGRHLIGPGDAAYGRNDDTLSTRDRSRRDELLGLPPERRPTLDRERTFRGTRRAEDYVYPSYDGRRGGRGYSPYRGYRRSY